MMAILAFRTGQYARDIFLSGIKKFSDIPAAYVVPVQTYAAESFTQAEIDAALAKGFISEDEYNAVIEIAYPQ